MGSLETRELLLKKIDGTSPSRSKIVQEAVFIIKEQQCEIEKLKKDIAFWKDLAESCECNN